MAVALEVEKRRWYAVCDGDCSYKPGEERDNAKVWTVSNNPVEPGWNTDSGHPGYGLTRADAEFLARSANVAGEYYTR